MQSVLNSSAVLTFKFYDLCLLKIFIFYLDNSTIYSLNKVSIIRQSAATQSFLISLPNAKFTFKEDDLRGLNLFKCNSV